MSFYRNLVYSIQTWVGYSTLQVIIAKPYNKGIRGVHFGLYLVGGVKFIEFPTRTKHAMSSPLDNYKMCLYIVDYR